MTTNTDTFSRRLASVVELTKDEKTGEVSAFLKPSFEDGSPTIQNSQEKSIQLLFKSIYDQNLKQVTYNYVRRDFGPIHVTKGIDSTQTLQRFIEEKAIALHTGNDDPQIAKDMKKVRVVGPVSPN